MWVRTEYSEIMGIDTCNGAETVEGTRYKAWMAWMVAGKPNRKFGAWNSLSRVADHLIRKDNLPGIYMFLAKVGGFCRGTARSGVPSAVQSWTTSHPGEASSLSVETSCLLRDVWPTLPISNNYIGSGMIWINYSNSPTWFKSNLV